MMIEPRIILKPAFTVVGLSQNGDSSHVGREALWDLLNQRYHEIPFADPDSGFGVHTWNGAEQLYLAGLSVRQVGAVPEGMTALTLGAHAYAVFPHRGDSAQVGATVEQIFTEWLPASGYRAAADYFFEYYDDRFQPGSAESLLFIYLPVYLKGEEDSG